MIITLMYWPPRRRSNCTGSRTAPTPYLSDEQWLLIANLFPHSPVAPQGGRPRVPPRPCLQGVLWVLTSGARWQALFQRKQGPERYPSPTTCWRRLSEWTDAGVFLAAWRRLLSKLDRFQGINWEEAIGDGSFSRANAVRFLGGEPRSATAAKAKAPPSC